jgi:hypothetical protein
MPKFGQIWFNGAPFGDFDISFTDFKKSIKRIPLGFKVRKSIGKKIIFRCRVGNGFIGSVKGKFYQDKYKYFVPSSINNPEGQHSRDVFAAGMHSWKNTLTDEERAVWNHKAKHYKGLFGWNLYLKKYMKDNL